MSVTTLDTTLGYRRLDAAPTKSASQDLVIARHAINLAATRAEKGFVRNLSGSCLFLLAGALLLAGHSVLLTAMGYAFVTAGTVGCLLTVKTYRDELEESEKLKKVLADLSSVPAATHKKNDEATLEAELRALQADLSDEGYVSCEECRP